MKNFELSTIITWWLAFTGDTQETVSAACGVTRRAIGYYASGERSCPYGMAYKMAKHWGISLREFLAMDSKNYRKAA